MTTQCPPAVDGAHYELLFRCLNQPGRGFSFPCDRRGRVNLDVLSDRARDNYFYVRAVVGNSYATPMIRQTL